MIFPIICRSFSRSPPATNVLTGGRSLFFKKGLLRDSYVNKCLSEFNGNLGFSRGYLASTEANKEFVSKVHLADLSYVLANPRICRYFSSKAPKKKNYENFYPKQKKEIPKEDGQKSN